MQQWFLKRVANYLGGEQSFCFTYGDGLSDVNISELLDFHRQHGKLATVTAITPPGRYGAILSEGNSVTGFQEKPPGDGALINGGFFVLDLKTIDLIEDDQTTQSRIVLANTYFADGARVVEKPTMVSGDWQKFIPGVGPGEIAASEFNPVCWPAIPKRKI